MTQHRLSGKVAVVTGASRGLGFRVAERLVEEGAQVFMLARGAGPLTEAAQQLGDRATALPTDLGSPDSVRAAFAAVASAGAGLDILINNAAIGNPYKVETATDADLRAEVDVNILGLIYCVREAIPLLRARGGGDIVNLSSESVIRPFPFLSVYAATKAAVENFSRNLREELRDDNIRVCLLRSGRMGESGFSQGWSPELRAQYGAEARAQGLFRFTGEKIAPALTARALVDVLCLPAEAHVDFLEVRSNVNQA